MKRLATIGQFTRIASLLKRAEELFPPPWDEATRRKVARWMFQQSESRELFDPKAAQTGEKQ